MVPVNRPERSLGVSFKDWANDEIDRESCIGRRRCPRIYNRHDGGVSDDRLPVVCPECGAILKWLHPDAYVSDVQHWDDDHHYIGSIVDLSGGFTPLDWEAGT